MCDDLWIYGGGRENFSLAPAGYGFWAMAGLRSENNCILSRWSQLLCDYYYFRLLRCVSAERILVLIDEGFLSDPEIQLTSQLKPQWELPWSVWGLIPALFQVSGFSLTVLSLKQALGISSVLLATRSRPQKTNGLRFCVSQTKVFLKFSYFLPTFENHGTLLTKTIDLPTADLSWLAQKPYASNSHFSFSPFAHPHTQSLPCQLDLDGPSLKALWISFRTHLKISRDKVQLKKKHPFNIEERKSKWGWR